MSSIGSRARVRKHLHSSKVLLGLKLQAVPAACCLDGFVNRTSQVVLTAERIDRPVFMA